MAEKQGSIFETPGQAVVRVARARFKVLVADDSAEDKYFMARGLSGSCCLEVVGSMSDGEMARSYLSGEGEHANRSVYPFPDLLLTDLDMPKGGGLELLAWIQSMDFCRLRVVVLSGTPDLRKIERAFELGADYFQVKSSNSIEVSAFVHRLELLMVLLEQRDQQRESIFPVPIGKSTRLPARQDEAQPGRIAPHVGSCKDLGDGVEMP